MKSFLRVLASVLFLSALTRSAPIEGKENVFDYKMSVGKEDGEQGFFIETKVLVKRHSDNTYNLQLTDIEVRDYQDFIIEEDQDADKMFQEKQAIDKEKSALLEAKLKIPFDFNPIGGESALTVYAPETKDCESTNIKRGLINLLEFYDSKDKTVKKISKISSSGNCQLVNTESETDTEVTLVKTVDGESNCTSELSNQILIMEHISRIMPSNDPKAKKNLVIKVNKSKDGSDAPKILIESTEQLRLTSSFPSGLFGVVTVKSVLELKEVRDAISKVNPSGTPSQSSTKIIVNSGEILQNSVKTQPELLTMAKDDFKRFQLIFKELDSVPTLEMQAPAAEVLNMASNLEKLNQESIKTLYKELDDNDLKKAFFQILGTAASGDAIDAVKMIVLEELDANNDAFYDRAALFYENIDSNCPSISSAKGRELMQLTAKVGNHSLPLSDSRKRLRNAIALKSSAIHAQKCVRINRSKKADKDCISGDELWGSGPSNEFLRDTESKILFMKVIGNWQVQTKAWPWLKDIIDDKNNPIRLRVDAVRACKPKWIDTKNAKYAAGLKETMTELFYDRSEDHEVRINAFIVLSKISNDSQKHVQNLVDNIHAEDRQVISAVTSVSNIQNKKLGPKSIFESGFYIFQTQDKKEMTVIGVIASKTDILPRAVSVNLLDPFQTRGYVIHTVSDGLVYGNIAKIKASHDKSQGTSTVPNAGVKNALDNIFSKAKGRPTNGNFSFVFTESVDQLDNSMQYFDSPQAVMQKLMSQGSDKFIRSFKKYNCFRVKTHTESGFPVEFLTSQGAITSLEVPQLSMGHASKATGIPISFKYSYKLVSNALYFARIIMPEAPMTYTIGKLGIKSMHVPRNVTLSVLKKKIGQLDYLTLKGKSDPLFGSYSGGKDIFLRSLLALRVAVPLKEKKTVSKRATILDVKSYGQNIFGVGVTITKTANYSRPSLLESNWARLSYKYQEVEKNTEPFVYKVSLTKSPENEGNSTINYEVTAISGFKDGQHVNMLGVTFDHPKDPAAKAIRVVVGYKVDAADPNKRAVSINYENAITRVFIQGHTVINMPDNNLKIPDVTKHTNEWALVYPSEKITLTGQSIFEPSGRKEVGDDDVRVLLEGLPDDKVYAESHAEFYRTDEQISLYSTSKNTVEDNLYSKLTAESLNDTRISIKAWDKLLKFNGCKGEVKFKKAIPEEIKNLHRETKTFLANRHFNFSTFDASLKTDENTMKISMNSSLDEMTDLIIQDETGATIIKGFKSKIIPLLRPSSSPIKTFYHNTFNQPICAVNGISRIETFDGRTLPLTIHNMPNNADCDLLLTSNCNGVKNMAFTYNIKDNAFTVLYERHKIVVSKTGFILDGSDQEDKNGLVKLVENIALLSYKGLFAVKLPNNVWLIRERDSSIGYIQASRLFRGRLCGLCGHMTGDQRQDMIDHISDFGMSGTHCPSRTP